MEVISSYTNLPKALGFGISSKEMAEKFSKYSDGIIVGSAIIKRIAQGKNLEDGINKGCSLVKEIKEVL